MTNTGFTSEFLRLPNPAILFNNRAKRLRFWAAQLPSLSGFLSLMADLAEIQHVLSNAGSTESKASHIPSASLPSRKPDISPNERLTDFTSARPPLDISNRPREPYWRQGLRFIAEHLKPTPDPITAILQRINNVDEDELDNWAERWLAADMENIDTGLMAFVAAALQVQWTMMAGRLDPGELDRPEPGYRCPICGFLPVACVLQTGRAVQGLRYLCCSLCASEWNRVRIRCVNCGSGNDMSYYGLEGEGETVKAEACGECKAYVKIMNREKDPKLDPVADDIATLALDILMAEKGFERLGLNPFMIPGG